MTSWIVSSIISWCFDNRIGTRALLEAEKAGKAGKPEAKTRKTAPSQAEMMREKMRQRGSQPMNPEVRMKRFREPYTEELARAKEGPENQIRALQAIKVVAEKEKAQMEQFDQLGLDVIPVPFWDVAAFGGGLHCATADIYREGNCEDYLPKQIEGF